MAFVQIVGSLSFATRRSFSLEKGVLIHNLDLLVGQTLFKIVYVMFFTCRTEVMAKEGLRCIKRRCVVVVANISKPK